MSYRELANSFCPWATAHFSLVDAIPYKEQAPVSIGSWATLSQVHGVQGYEQKKSQLHLGKEGDWHYSFEKDLGLGVFVADCTAILFAGESKGRRFIAAIHAGWRGTAAGIIEKAIEELKPDSGFYTWLSPSISAAEYEVDQAVIDQFPVKILDSISKSRPGHFFLDLKTYQKRILEGAGAKVWASSLCTSLQPEFFSYRASGGKLKGRHLAWISM